MKRHFQVGDCSVVDMNSAVSGFTGGTYSVSNNERFGTDNQFFDVDTFIPSPIQDTYMNFDSAIEPVSRKLGLWHEEDNKMSFSKKYYRNKYYFSAGSPKNKIVPILNDILPDNYVRFCVKAIFGENERGLSVDVYLPGNPEPYSLYDLAKMGILPPFIVADTMNAIQDIISVYANGGYSAYILTGNYHGELEEKFVNADEQEWSNADGSSYGYTKSWSSLLSEKQIAVQQMNKVQNFSFLDWFRSKEEKAPSVNTVAIERDALEKKQLNDFAALSPTHSALVKVYKETEQYLPTFGDGDEYPNLVLFDDNTKEDFGTIRLNAQDDLYEYDELTGTWRIDNYASKKLIPNIKEQLLSDLEEADYSNAETELGWSHEDAEEVRTYISMLIESIQNNL